MSELYKQMIKQHYQSPIGFKTVFSHNHQQQGVNPTCGDHIHLYANIQQQQLQQLGFDGDACAICIASCSLLCEYVNTYHPSLTLIQEQGQQLLCHLTQGEQGNEGFPWQVLLPVQQFPTRIQCALLPWQTVQHMDIL